MPWLQPKRRAFPQNTKDEMLNLQLVKHGLEHPSLDWLHYSLAKSEKAVPRAASTIPRSGRFEFTRGRGTERCFCIFAKLISTQWKGYRKSSLWGGGESYTVFLSDIRSCPDGTEAKGK